jgi:hypothetical protein
VEDPIEDAEISGKVSYDDLLDAWRQVLCK